MGIAEKIRQIWIAKIAIRNAIRAKGVTVADSEPMSGYASKISQIQSGGGSGDPIHRISYAVSSGQVSAIQRIELPPVARIADRVFSGVSCIEYAFAEGIQEIGLSSFGNNGRLLELNLPNSINLIGQDAFIANTGLTSLRIGFGTNPAPLVLSSGSFMNCRFIKTIEIGGRIKRLPYQTFSGNDRLESITVPPELTHVDQYCFNNCYQLRQFSSEYVVEAGSYAFSGCTNLHTVYLPNCTTIQARLFDRCTNLANVTLSDNIQNLRSDLFVNCNVIKSIIFPRNAEVALQRLVYSCAEVRYVEFGDKLNTITSYPLILGAPKLRAVVFRNPTPPTIATPVYSQFDQVDKTQLKVYVPDESLDAYKARFATDQALFYPMSQFVMPSLT